MKKLYFALVFAIFTIPLMAQNKDAIDSSTKVATEKQEAESVKEETKKKIRADIRKRRMERKAEMKKARKNVAKRVEKKKN